MNDKPSRTRTRTEKMLLGCAAGCGLVALLMISTCVGFVAWLNRPGELLEPARLRGEDTTAYVEWTLRLEDPGTAALVEELLAGLSKMQERGPSPFPEGIDRFLRNFQDRRNEKQMQQLFPCVVAWTWSAGETADDDLHLISVSVQKLGNRLVLADWLLGWIIGDSDDLQVIRHGGEKIYYLPREDKAFFLRRSDFFFTTDLETARRAVDRLAATPAAAEPSHVDQLLAGITGKPLRGAATNQHGETEEILGLLVGTSRADLVRELEWDNVRGMSLTGGFTEESSFEATLDILIEAPGWPAEHADAAARAIAGTLGTDEARVRVEAAEAPGGGVRFELEIADLPAFLETMVDRID